MENQSTDIPAGPAVIIPPPLLDAVNRLFREGRHHQHRDLGVFVRDAMLHELERCAVDPGAGDGQ